jgi:hypothetical protein
MKTQYIEHIRSVKDQNGTFQKLSNLATNTVGQPTRSPSTLTVPEDRSTSTATTPDTFLSARWQKC